MVAATHLLGVALALGAAFSAACNRLFVRAGTEEGTAAEAFFVVMTLSTVIIVPAVAVVYYPAYRVTAVAAGWFVAGGVAGSIFGNFWLYSSIERIGASRTQPIIASNALIASVIAYFVLDETLTPLHGLGVAMIVVGVAAIAWETTRGSGDGASRRYGLVSILLPLAAAFAFGAEPIFASLGLEAGTPAPVGLAIKTAAAWLGYTLYFSLRSSFPSLSLVREANGRWYVLAGVAYVLFLLGYYVGLEVAPVNVVTPMIITNTLFVIVLSAVFMPQRLERVTWKLGVAATVVVAGALIVTVQG